MDVIEYAKSLKSAGTDKLLRLGIVDSIVGVGRVTVVIGDDTIPVAARSLGSYQPEVGDTVSLLVDGSDLLVLGSVQKAIEVDSRDFTLNPILTTELDDGAVTNPKVALNAINVANIVDGAVARVKIAEAAINAALIDMGAVTETKIADDSISTPKLQADSVVATKIVAGAIETFHLTAGAVTTDKVDARAITAEKIAVGTITANEILGGTITGDRIAGTTITGANIFGGTISADKITSGTLTSASGVFGTISADNITTGTLNANNVTITNLSVTNAMITSLSASKITVGTISASISITSPTITGGTATFASSNVRISDGRGIEIVSGTDNWNELNFVSFLGGSTQFGLASYPALNMASISTSQSTLDVQVRTGTSFSGTFRLGSSASNNNRVNLVVDNGSLTVEGTSTLKGNTTITGNISNDGYLYCGTSTGGGSTTPIYSFSGNGTTGMYRLSTDNQIRFTVSGNYVFGVGGPGLDGFGSIGSGRTFEWEAGTLDLRRDVGSSNEAGIRSFATESRTTTASANLHITSFANFSRSTSSIEYKREVEDIAKPYYDKVFDLRPVYYRSKATEDRTDWSYYGLIAEEVALVDPRLVRWGHKDGAEVMSQYENDPESCPQEDLVPQGVEYERVAMFMLPKLKEQELRIQELEKLLPTKGAR
ncbi:MAG: hypothetical protein LC650_01550 [Actinobacteria bacterium]|nr:hypothetical protein [Actinomycetota bacterium]